MSEIENSSKGLAAISAEILEASEVVEATEVVTEEVTETTEEVVEVEEAKKPVKEEEADAAEDEAEEEEVTETAAEEEEAEEEEVTESSDEDDEDDSDEDDSDEDDSDDEEAVKEETTTESGLDYSADLDALVTGEEDLSEDFRIKASAIFEAATTAKLASEIDRLEEQYAENLETEVSDIAETLADKVDAYLAYVVETWVESNKVALENGLRTEIAEDFMSSLQTVFKENYIEVPESKVDLVDELADKVAKLEESLNTTTDENVRLSESVRASERAEIVRKYSDGLATTESEKLAALVEDVEFVDAETFAMKVDVISKSYFAEATVTTEEEDESVIGNEAATAVDTTSAMSIYAAALSK